MSNLRALAALALAASLAACQAVGTDAPVSRRDAPPAQRGLPLPQDEDPIAAILTAEAEAAEAAGTAVLAVPVRPTVVRGPAASTFLGRPVADLEALTGAPALTRREGKGEFRRYDLERGCRAFAVVSPPGGAVVTLETGAAIQGQPAPAFEDCTARASAAQS